ncbi:MULTISPECIES: HD family phosphohydrolase [unclassified Granulicatella]|uniref:HD family phosphohydrolase n=1 Tax=unclassified Granulicatella TaxID=2630493 RepID=UPI0010748DF9|nr:MULTISPECIES: HDIG domain-containing metalloprotein [unclassified Granulicatella]MBF0780925.1 HDIG domain-containing protein [Granulicatella sp. 19428wC4_WM01]TFU93203.1 HDIG domain-containing protein [Granulicatella sp. WM01]
MKKIIQTLDERLGYFYVPFVLCLLSGLLFVAGYPFVKQTEIVVSLNNIATQTIRASKTIEDTDATEKARENAVQNVQPAYEKDDTIVTSKIAQVTRFFEVMTVYRKELSQSNDLATLDSRANDIISKFVMSLQRENKELYDYAYVFSDNVLKKILLASETEYTMYESLTKSTVENVLNDKIYSNSSDIAKAQNDAYSQILTKTYSDAARELLKELVTPAIVATMVVNQVATESAKQTARDNVSPIMIMQGDVIVREGEVIGNAAYKKLQLLGMTSNQHHYQLLLGYLFILVIQFALVWYFIVHETDTLTKRNVYVNMYSFLIGVLSALMIVAHLVQKAGLEYFSLIVPIGLLPFFIVPKAKRRLALLAVIFLVIMYLFISDNGSSIQGPIIWKFYTLTGVFASIVISGTRKKYIGHQFILLVLLYNALVVALALLSNIDLFSHTFMMMCVYTVVNVFLTFVLLRLGQPYFDLLFEDKAVLRMLELSNPNQPLLKELIANAPGTYHHSIMVANLSANAVELIGGDSLFTRVACYYHDIGKLKNPMFFVENLPAGMASPHKLLTPQESRDIIFAHVSDGVKRLKQAGLPQSVIDICAEHHGKTVLKYFYVTAKNEDEHIDKNDFRYPGPKPQTKESAVISIADTVEAAARAMKNPDIDSLTTLVQETIHSRIEDGQFDECPITVQELKIVEKSLITGLSSSYHTRVEYPKLNSRKGKKA